MARTLPDSTLSRFNDFAATHLGLSFPRSKWDELERGLLGAARDFGFTNPGVCLNWLMSAPPKQAQLEVLASWLTVGETYFFRERHAFECLEDRVFPALIAARTPERRLRIWSAGCATGEEPYSVAISLSRVLPDWQSWNVTLLATDVNSKALRAAIEGRYGRWSFREGGEWLKEYYVPPDGAGRFRVRQEFRGAVTFAYHNLVADPYPSVANNTNAMDVILCRNVLMYFTPEVREMVVAALRRSLVTDGWLIVGATELQPDLFPGFELLEGAPVLRRVDPSPAAAVPVKVAPEEPQPVRSPCDEPQASRLYAAGRYDEAAACLRPRNDPAARLLLARIEANRGALAAALRLCEEAVARAKLDSECWYLHAAILDELGRRNDAAQSLYRAIELEPDFVLAHMALGALLERMGAISESRHQFESALSLLGGLDRNAMVPHAEEMTAGRLTEAIRTRLAAQSDG